jgi:hypothetical protein
MATIDGQPVGATSARGGEQWRGQRVVACARRAKWWLPSDSPITVALPALALFRLDQGTGDLFHRRDRLVERLVRIRTPPSLRRVAGDREVCGRPLPAD